MKTNSIVAFLFVGTLLFGCTASVDSGQGSPELTGTSAEKLTTSQCATQRDTCLKNNPLFGILGSVFNGVVMVGMVFLLCLGLIAG